MASLTTEQQEQIVQAPRPAKLLRMVANTAYVASRENAPECDSYGWIVLLIDHLHFDLILRDDLTFGCIPQGRLKGDVGIRAPDFKLILCSREVPLSRAGEPYLIWEVKNFAPQAIIITWKYNLDNRFGAEFITAFPQLKEHTKRISVHNDLIQLTLFTS